MNDFFSSKFVKDLQAGILPPVAVSIDQDNVNKLLVKVVIAALLIGVGLSLIKKIF